MLFGFRFVRKTLAKCAQRRYTTEFEADLLMDFDICRQLDEAAQRQWIEKLRLVPKYVGRLLSEQFLGPGGTRFTLK